MQSFTLESTRKHLVFMGAGGFCREVLQYWPLVQLPIFLVDEMTVGRKYGNTPIYPTIQTGLNAFRTTSDCCEFLVCVGDPKLKKKLWNRALESGLEPHGPGIITRPGVMITCGVKIGQGVTVNLNSTIGHDSIIKEFVTISPGVNVSGNCCIGEGAFIGTGACIREGVTIGKWATVGMGSVVLKDVPDGETWVGNPAHKIR